MTGLVPKILVSRFEILDGGVSASVEKFEILDLYQIRLKYPLDLACPSELGRKFDSMQRFQPPNDKRGSYPRIWYYSTDESGSLNKSLKF